ncbi:PREDICTED: intraflagellar transport protein 46 homolog [Ceratosolen solmsi marchali]|uniref:Intraflagellar transport protein 46 homolog n=1 Tax=Ceratosolen solmsi marchali TaxID=326594 RepID=A0AAJ7E0I7_9HYME|nr:PREDICTED: intraflagellar transport protein 46 homolog [Ceratosolen solmsi marchali]
MAAQDSSEEEERSQDISAFTNFDESIDVRNAVEVKSPVIEKQVTTSIKLPKSKRSIVNGVTPEVDVRSPRMMDFRRYSVPEESFNKVIGLGSETSDSEDSEELNNPKISKTKQVELYNFKQFEDLEVSTEVRELFQNIIRYTPQKIELDYKLIPFIPDYIPAVGDIDAFLKVPRPDGISDQIGLTVLDEPAVEQSEPAVLHLQLRSKTRSATGSSKASVVKRLEDVSKQGRMINKWIEDMGELYRSKYLPTVEISKQFPDMEALLCQWPSEIENKLYLGTSADFDKLDCDLLQLIDLICALLDIPVYGSARIESLHTLFFLYTQVYNIDIQTIHHL